MGRHKLVGRAGREPNFAEAESAFYNALRLGLPDVLFPLYPP